MNWYMETYLVQGNSLERLFEALLQNGNIVVAPLLKNNKIVYDVAESFADVQSGFIQTSRSFKEITFPRTEVLFGYKKENDSITLKEPDREKIPNIIIWGSRSCDAKASAALKALFNWDTKDSFFNSRSEKMTVISFSCKTADEYCFCTSVGCSPGNTEGSDILITQFDNDVYYAEIITGKGKDIVAKLPDIFTKTEDNKEKEKHLANVPVRFNHKEISQKLNSIFETDVWQEQSLRCLGCGACAFVCPVCSCFDIQDESHGRKGTRIRCWDSCGFSLFTMHTSGHNPRETQSQRWRQRLLHKFTYMPERLSVYGCTGCGRCSRACPADMNILEHLNSLQEG